MTRTAALEYAKVRVRVKAISPGALDTPMLGRIASHRPQRAERMAVAEPVGRMGRPEERAETAVWLCSEAVSFVTGQAMAADGGMAAR